MEVCAKGESLFWEENPIYVVNICFAFIWQLLCKDMEGSCSEVSFLTSLREEYKVTST